MLIERLVREVNVSRPTAPIPTPDANHGGSPGEHRGLWPALTALLVIAGIAGAVLGAQAVARSDRDRSRLNFHLDAAAIASTLKLAIQREEDLVLTGSSFVAWNADTTPRGFNRWAQSVDALGRYPELQDIGLIRFVPAARVHAFAAQMAAEPLEPFGPGGGAVSEPLQILPLGKRPFYCFATAGLVRNRAAYLPTGVDYCALAKPSLTSARDQGRPSFAPFRVGHTLALGMQTPIYRDGIVPATVAARRRAFIGWLGELLTPQVVIARALQEHPGMAVVFSFGTGASRVVFDSGRAAAHAQQTTIALRNGWTVQALGDPLRAGVLADRNALFLLVGGVITSLLLGLLFVVLGTSRTRALSLVREKTRELSHLALHDPLTGLPNRALVLDRAEQMLARVARDPGMRAGALFVDVDGFKHVNDRLGHAAGDELLRAVAERLRGAVRDQDTVGRLGGDEFVVLVEVPHGGPSPEQLADRLIEALRHPVELDQGGRVVAVTASVGVAVGRYDEPDQLLRDADLALYAAKAEGRDRYVLFDPRLGADVDGRIELESDLGSALQRGQLFLLYQPIFELPHHRVTSVEALLRWRHPTRGVVAPNVFIPLAEESGLIVPIGRWVLHEACREAAGWCAEGRRLGISVNVSARQLGRSAFSEDVESALRESGLDPSLLTLEITETTLMRDVPGAAARLTAIKELGVRVAIDDFGTGYASLSNLQQMPVDVLKIDRSFVAALGDGGHSRELLEAILGVGQALSLRVVAEGIEVQSQMTALEEMGCEMAQGFLMGRPSPPEAIAMIIAAPPSPSWRPS
jgi:diguanylate cyclase (GGDEF)-like protein